MRIVLVFLLVFACGCRKASEKAESSDAKVEVRGDKVAVQTPDGRAVVEKNGDTTVIRATEKGKETTITARGDTTRVQTGDGTLTMGEKKVPEGFPLAVMPGVTVERGAHMTQANSPEVYQLSIRTDAAPAQVADFYEKAFKDKGLKVQRTETRGDGTTQAVVAGESDKVEATCVAVKDARTGRSEATIYWSARN
ncbi:MAG: hypothetical protein ACPMAQ_13590 [Phycisphaerae bacterium]